MAVPRHLPSATKLCAWSAKEKNQADAAAGELPAQAGPGKRCSACSQAGGHTAPAWWGGVGRGHPTEGHPSSESSAEATASSTGGWSWPALHGAATRSRPMQQLQADAWGRKGRCSASDSRTTQHGAALCLPSPLLSLPASCQPVGKAVLVHCPEGLLEQEQLKPKPGSQSRGTSGFLRAWQPPCRASTARRWHGTVTKTSAGQGAACLHRGHAEPSLVSSREKRLCLHSPHSVLPAESKELPTTKAKQCRHLAPTPAAVGGNQCFPSQREGTLARQPAHLRCKSKAQQQGRDSRS